MVFKEINLLNDYLLTHMIQDNFKSNLQMSYYEYKLKQVKVIEIH